MRTQPSGYVPARVAGFLLTIALLLSLASCSLAPVWSHPTATATPTNTPVPTATSTPTATATPTSTSTATTTPTPTTAPLEISLRLEPRAPQQGDIVTLVVATNRPAAVTATLRGNPLPMAQEGERWYALIGIWAATEPAAWPITVQAVDEADGSTAAVQASLRFSERAFEIENIDLDEETTTLLTDTEALQQEAALVARVVAPRTTERLWSGPFHQPIQGEVSSTYGLRRGYNGGPANDYHGGLDLAAAEGVPVGATQAGRVVLAQRLHVRGNCVIIDHGWGLYSGYYHLSAINVQEGEYVTQGQTIGLVGSTGLSTGPHLHWSIWVGGSLVDPALLLQWELPH